MSGKEAANDPPDWAKYYKPKVGEDGKTFAKRLMDEKYRVGKWKGKVRLAEFSKIKKWCDRAFE